MLARLSFVVQDVPRAESPSDGPWERYERAKKLIRETAKSAAEYEARVRKAAAELDL